MPMKRAHYGIARGFACLFLLCIGWVAAQDWPQWRGPNRDGKTEGFLVPAKWPATLTEKWRLTVGEGDATPALVGGKLYLFTRQGDQEVAWCLDAATAEVLWKDQYEAQAVTGAAARHPGPRSSPAVVDGKVVTLGVGGVLSCLDAETGKVLWRNDPFPRIVPRFFTSMSPMFVDGLVIAHLGGEGNGAILAYNADDGSEKWRWNEEGPAYASPVLMHVDGVAQIVTLTEKSVVGIAAADGSLLWRLPFVPSGRVYNAATPIVDGRTVIYTGAGRGTFAVKIQKQDDTFTVEQLWANPELAPQYNSPVLRAGRLFGLSDKGNLFCLNAETGQRCWVDSATLDRSGFGPIVDAGSVLMVLPSNAELIVFEPDDKSFKELTRIKVSEASIYAHPVLSGKWIFIKDQQTITLYELE
jgi:outer membrane protein assembly factor BamB